MTIMSKFENISNEELEQRRNLLYTKSESLRLSLIKQCAELDSLYKELVLITGELKIRKESNG